MSTVFVLMGHPTYEIYDFTVGIFSSKKAVEDAIENLKENDGFLYTLADGDDMKVAVHSLAYYETPLDEITKR